MDQAVEEAWKKYKRISQPGTAHVSFAKYVDDPVGFGTDFLGEFYTDDMVAVSNSVRDNISTIVRSATDVGKSFVAARICWWFFSVFPDSKVYLTAAPPIENLRQILWGEIINVLRKRPSLASGYKVRSLSIVRHAQSFMTGVAIPNSGSSAEKEAKFSGRHAPHLLFVVDEGDAVPEEVYTGIEGCMSGGSVVRLLVMFNPRHQSGVLYRREKNHQANVVEISALDHPNVTSGDNVIPGAVTRETTLRRINMWTRPLHRDEPVTAACFQVPDFLVGEKVTGMDGAEYPPLSPGTRKIEEPSFSYMVLGKYPAQSVNQLISDSWIDDAVTRWRDYVSKNGEIPPAIQPTMGLDMAEFGTDSNVAFLRYDSFVAKPIVWAGVDTDYTARRGLDIYRKYGVNIAMVDATGIGSGVAPSMVRLARPDDVRAVSVKVSSRPSGVMKSELGEFYQLRDQLWWLLREWIEKNPNAMIPPDGFLLDELRAIEYDVSNGKIRVTSKEELRKKLRRSPDRADSLCLTFAPFERSRWVRING